MARFEIAEGWTAQAFRFALDPTPAQVSLLESHCGAARFAFNHMLGVVKSNWISAQPRGLTAFPATI